MITIKYLGPLAELLSTAEEQIEWSSGSVTDLFVLLKSRDETWNSILTNQPNLKIAINHYLATMNTDIQNNDEIAILPPVTGG